MKHVIATTSAPGAVGPYSQAIEANGFVFVSGQLPLDPATGAFVSDNTAEQAEQSIKNLLAVLEAAGCKAEDVIKTTVFMIDIGERGLRQVFQRRLPRTLRDAGQRAAQGRTGRDRGHRGQAVNAKTEKKREKRAVSPFLFLRGCSIIV